jgi:hypothetical protein
MCRRRIIIGPLAVHDRVHGVLRLAGDREDEPEDLNAT